MNGGIDPSRGTAAGASPAIPDVAAPQNGAPALVESDTDVDSDPDVPEDLEPPTPDVGHPKSRYLPPKPPADVTLKRQNPDVPPVSHGDGDSDTDVELEPPTPDVGHLKSRYLPPKPPADVTLKRANPDVPPLSHDDGDSDTDVELEPPTPDVGRPRTRRIRLKTPQHPDVRHNNGDIDEDSETDIEGDPPNPAVPTPKTPQNIWTDPPVVPETPDPDVAASNSPFLAPNSGDGKDSDSDGDPSVFLEPTQNFLSPENEGWDPEEPTQRFDPPEEEEKETPPPSDTWVLSRTPGSPPDARVPAVVTASSGEDMSGPRHPGCTPAPPFEGTQVSGKDPGIQELTPPPEVGAGLRRSQRLAKSRGGGAKEGGASGPAPPSPASQPRRSARLRPRPPTPEPPIRRPRPPAKPRPPRRRAPEEAEPALVPGPKLRPRAGPSDNPPQVLFTGVVATPALLVALGTLGGSVAADVTSCSHLVTDRVRRTVKFLCGVARGVPIVTPQWLLQSAAAGRVLSPGPFLVSDPEREGQFGFRLSLSLRKARQRPLLQGYEIHVTPGVRPPPEEMRDIVTCAGGTFLPRMPRAFRPRLLVVTCPADAARWGRAQALDLPLNSAELLLTGVLRQSLELLPFRLPATPLGQTPPPTPPP